MPIASARASRSSVSRGSPPHASRKPDPTTLGQLSRDLAHALGAPASGHAGDVAEAWLARDAVERRRVEAPAVGEPHHVLFRRMQDHLAARVALAALHPA